VHRCHFGGLVVLGSFRGSVRVDGVDLPSQVRDSVVVDSCVLHGAYVAGCRLVSRTVVGEACAVVNCGFVGCQGDAPTAFGNGTALPLGVETGGRDVVMFADMLFDQATAACTQRKDGAGLARYRAAAAAYAAAASMRHSVLGAGARVLDCPTVRAVFIGQGALVQASDVTGSTVLSGACGADRTTIQGSSVRGSIVQWGCSVERMAVVDGSLMCEHSHVDKHGKLLDSLLGPNSGVSEGEVTSSLVGPFVGFHHQALLIASVWPGGKGNVGYGANVGSNHTGKAPDQELWPGEGVFFGQ